MPSEKSLKFVPFGEFSFDLVEEELRRGDEVVALRPQASRALKALILRPNEVVSHNDLRIEIWGNSAVPKMDGLHQVIREIRRALGEDSQSPRFIRTQTRRGYRFCATAGAGYAARAKGRIPGRFRPRDMLLYSGGVATLPLLVLLACIASGIGR